MTRALRPCIDCGARFRSPGSRCAACESKRQRRRNQIRARTTEYRTAAYQRYSLEQRRREPWCHHPTCPRPLTRDLTWDHEHKRVECRSCNSSHRRNVS